MDYYINTRLFTLIPTEVYNSKIAEEYIKEHFNVSDKLDYFDISIPAYNAILGFYAEYPKCEQNNQYPIIYKLIQESEQLQPYNKVLVHYSAEDKLTNLLIVTGNKLQLANIYNTENFNSLLYYIFAGLKKLQINPKQTHIMIYNPICKEEEELLKRYFHNIEVKPIAELLK